jgi:hypothetical protein
MGAEGGCEAFVERGKKAGWGRRLVKAGLVWVNKQLRKVNKRGKK